MEYTRCPAGNKALIKGIYKVKILDPDLEYFLCMMDLVSARINK